MKIELKVPKEYDAKYLLVNAGVRYWEDATIDGIEDVEGDLIPCRDGDMWKPLIDIELGIIVNWKQGTTADIHYKVCDDGMYILLDENKEQITNVSGYVIDMMCPEGEGFGDYIIMKVDNNGKIAKWNPSFDEFKNED